MKQYKHLEGMYKKQRKLSTCVFTTHLKYKLEELFIIVYIALRICVNIINHCSFSR